MRLSQQNSFRNTFVWMIKLYNLCELFRLQFRKLFKTGQNRTVRLLLGTQKQFCVGSIPSMKCFKSCRLFNHWFVSNLFLHENYSIRNIQVFWRDCSVFKSTSLSISLSIAEGPGQRNCRLKLKSHEDSYSTRINVSKK